MSVFFFKFYRCSLKQVFQAIKGVQINTPALHERVEKLAMMIDGYQVELSPSAKGNGYTVPCWKKRSWHFRKFWIDRLQRA
jgi:hypothetical protein